MSATMNALNFLLLLVSRIAMVTATAGMSILIRCAMMTETARRNAQLTLLHTLFDDGGDGE